MREGARLDSSSVKITSAVALLDRAEELVSEAEGGLSKVWALRSANEELDRIELQIETADMTLQDDALQAVIDAEVDAPDPSTVRAQVEDAEGHTDDAEHALSKVSRPATTTTYRQRAASLRERIHSARDQLAAMNGTEQN